MQEALYPSFLIFVILKEKEFEGEFEVRGKWLIPLVRENN